MKNPPSFQFYPQDFISDFNVQDMSMEERGIYIMLLCHCWIENGLPAGDSDPIATLFKSRKVAKCFHKKNGRFRNPRLDREREKQLAFHKSQTEAGLRGAEARWGRHSKPIATPMRKNASSSSSSNKENPLTPFEKGGERKPNNRRTRRLAVGAHPPATPDEKAIHAQLGAYIKGLWDEARPSLDAAREKGKAVFDAAEAQAEHDIAAKGAAYERQLRAAMKEREGK